MRYCKIDLNHFLNLEFPDKRICEKKALILDPDYFWQHRGQYNHPYKLKTVSQVVEYYKDDTNLSKQKLKSKEFNWEYFNCLLYGFRKNVLDTDIHKINGGNEITSEARSKTLTPDYYNNLEEMSDDELLEFNKNNPVDFNPTCIKHGTHRAYAMIGRLIRGQKYIPFFVNQENYNPTIKLNHIQELDELQIPKSEYTLCQSAILTLMGIRSNDDIDIVVSSKLRDYSLEGDPAESKFGHIEIFKKDHGKFKAFGCTNDDELISSYSINIHGYNFVEPRFYFSRIWPNSANKIKDQVSINEFFKQGQYKKYPYNLIPLNKWGFELLPSDKLGNLK